MALDEDACAICEGDRSTNRNPIMFCDGGCNVPVHKDCYGVDEIPDGDWYCQRCEARRNNKPTRIVCCPQETGAFKTTMKPGNFMHIVCAKFNPAIMHDQEPYNVNRLRIDEQQCFKCELTQGYCIRCEEAGCQKYFHLTCGINAGLIAVSKKVPDTYTPRCNEHQPQDTIKKRLFRRFGTQKVASKARRRRLIQRESSPEEDQDESQDEPDDESEDEEAKEEEDEEEEDEEEDDSDDSDDDMGTKKRKRKAPLKKRRATAPHGKKGGGPIKLFMSDQSDDDESDDQMGSSNSNNSSNTKPQGMLDLIEAKRKKSLQKQQSPSPVAPVTPPLQIKPLQKQKLPNKTHLMPSTTTITKPVFRDLDDLQNDIVAQRRSTTANIPFDAPLNGERRNTLPPTQKPIVPGQVRRDLPAQLLAPPQQQQPPPPPPPPPSSPLPPADLNDTHKAFIKHKISEIMEEVLAQPNTSVKQTNGDESLRQELQRVREENRRLMAFRRNVAEVFEGLNVRVPSGLPVSVDKIEDYVNELRSMFVRSGAVRDQDHARITQCVEDMIIEQL